MAAIPGGGLLRKFFGRTVGEAAAFGIGGALEAPLEPLLRELVNETRARLRNYPVGPETAAGLAAQKIWTAARADTEAAHEGVPAGTLTALIELLRTAPGTAEALDLWRRGRISEADVDHALDKAGLEDRYRAGVKDLLHERLSPADIANAMQQGFVDDQGLLTGATGGSPPFAVPFTELNLSATDEAAASGVDQLRLQLLAELVGLPPGPETLLEMWRRNIITEESVDHGIREGHTKTKWSAPLKELRQRILSVHEYVTLHLKGWIDEQAMHAGAELSGYTPADADLLYLAAGRPAAPGQMAVAVARGVATEADFLKAIKESDVRPEYGPLLYAIRYHYPSITQMRLLVQGKQVDAATAIQWLEYQSYAPDVATKLVAAWQQGTTSRQKQLTAAEVEALYEGRYIDQAQATSMLTALGYTASEVPAVLELADARRVKRFLESAVSKIRTLYVKRRLTDQQAISELDQLGIAAPARDDLMAFWRLERGIDTPTLTPAQIASAVFYQVLTRDEGIAELVGRGYTDRDARIAVDVRMHGPPAPGQI